MRVEEAFKLDTAEVDAQLSARARRAHKRVDDLLRDRTRKRQRLLKRGRDVVDPWLHPEALQRHADELRQMSTHHHSHSRGDRATRQSRKALKPVALTHLKPATIVDAWVPFADSDEYKRRPAVVVSADRFDVRLFPLTSSVQHRRLKVPLHLLAEWRQSGLNRPTGMQQVEVEVPRTRILGVTGQLHGEDLQVFHRWSNPDRKSAAAISRMIAAASPTLAA